MSWNTFHHRGEILREVMTTADRRRDGVLPMDVPGVTDHFTDELDLVGALQLKWSARLSGNLERALQAQPVDLEVAVASAWRLTAEQLPGVRLVIDRAADHPASPEMEKSLRRAQELEWARLATAAGLASGQDSAAAAAGRHLEERARRVAVAEPARQPMPSLADRIKAVLAA